MAELQVANEEYTDIRNRVIDARRATDNAYWELSLALHEVYENSYYVSWGYTSWKDYVELELQVAPRKAAYLVAIQESFGKLSDDVTTWVKDIGWSKSKELIGVLDDENLHEWKERIDGKTLREVTEIVRDYKNPQIRS